MTKHREETSAVDGEDDVLGLDDDGSTDDDASAAEAAGNGHKADLSDDSKSQKNVDADRVLRLERRVDQLIDLLVSQQQDEPDEESDAAAAAAQVQSLLDKAPKEGYEGLQDFISGVAEAVQELRLRTERAEKRLAEVQENKPREALERFQDMTPDWEKYDKAMADICRKFGFKPQTVAQFRDLHKIAKGLTEAASTRSELETVRRGGAVPRVAGPSRDLRALMKSSSKPREGAGLADLVSQGVDRARARNRA